MDKRTASPPTGSRTRAARTCASTRTTRSTGTRGARGAERAQRERKPILLSIGYAACHWCHVMAHESFEDEATAALMNELFVNIKVDREERPTSIGSTSSRSRCSPVAAAAGR
jgi:thioredoxin-related protein